MELKLGHSVADLGLSSGLMRTTKQCLGSRRRALQHGAGIPTCRRYISGGVASTETNPARPGSNVGKEGGVKIQIDATAKSVNAAGTSLPLSPLMDPSFHEARTRFMQPKKAESSTLEKDKFRRLLERNPYARALSSPCRTCVATEVLLPRYFLQDFKLVAHSETGRPWWISPSVVPDETPATTTQASQPAQPSEGGQVPSGKPTLGKVIPSGPTGYFLARRDLIAEFPKPRRFTYSGVHQRRLFRIKETWSDMAARAEWRQDMDTVLLELMRRRIVASILHFAKLCEGDGRRYLIKCQGWDKVKDRHTRGCVLWLGKDSDGLQGEGVARAAQTEPSHFATVDVPGRSRDSKLPVHDLGRLLGEENLMKLRQGSAFLRDGELFLLGRRRTLDLQLKLWKLQGYLAEW